jgi:(4S)-4-hydroxy-5-phosphonooxypentane-2,3-dione isomerase
MSQVFVVIAEFEVSAEHKAEFLEVCRFDSVRSTTDEAGCRQFDVLTSDESPTSVALYEVYDDRAAFDVHLTMPHFTVFSEATKRLGVETKAVRFFAR